MNQPTRAAIFPPGWAEMTAKNAGQKYCPSNGSEGDLFINAWCHCCAKRPECEIVGLTLAFSREDEEYPQEWQYAPDGQPCCTAFVDADNPATGTPRCDLTVDMFDAAPEVTFQSPPCKGFSKPIDGGAA